MKDSEAGLERKRIEEKCETFMKNQNASSGVGSFSKVTSKNSSDSTEDSTDEEMSTTGEYSRPVCDGTQNVK